MYVVCNNTNSNNNDNNKRCFRENGSGVVVLYHVRSIVLQVLHTMLMLLVQWHFVWIWIFICWVSGLGLYFSCFWNLPNPVVARSKVWVCGRSLTGIAGLNAAWTMGVCLLLSVLCGQVEVSASGWSLVQGSPTEFGVSDCAREASTMRRP
jgi:hypothetical protein